MSVTEPDAEVVQPDDEGQGGGGQDAPYAEYLNRIPEEVRDDVEPIFKEWDGQVTRRFQESAEYRKAWQPYEELGVNQRSPEEVQWLLEFAQAAQSSPQSIKEWYELYATQNGLLDAQRQEPQKEPEPSADQWGQQYQDPDAQALETLLNSKLSPLHQELETFKQWREQQDYQTRFNEAQQYVQAQIAELKEKHPSEFNEAAIEKLVAQYVDSDPRNAVQRAFADWQSIRSQIEKDTLQSKVDQPLTPESGGVAASAPEEIKTLADANRIALARLREARET